VNSTGRPVGSIPSNRPRCVTRSGSEHNAIAFGDQVVNAVVHIRKGRSELPLESLQFVAIRYGDTDMAHIVV
jgi:hypothetical protein